MITPENYKEIVWPLPASDLLGIGRATNQKLKKYGIHTVGDVARCDVTLLKSWLGQWGLYLYSFANGQDTSPVQRLGTEAIVKSVGNSTTAPRDLCNEQDCHIVFFNLAESVAARLRELGLKGSTVQISLRDNDLLYFERQKKLEHPTFLTTEICDAAIDLLRQNYSFPRPLRSIGVRATGLVPEFEQNQQLSLFMADDEKRKKKEKIERTIDEIRSRFGYYAINTALMKIDPILGKLNAKRDNIIHPVGYLR